MPGELLGLREGGEPAGERARPGALRELGQIERHRLRRGGQRGIAVAGAPGGEVAPVGGVGAAGIGGLRLGEVPGEGTGGLSPPSGQGEGGVRVEQHLIRRLPSGRMNHFRSGPADRLSI